MEKYLEMLNNEKVVEEIKAAYVEYKKASIEDPYDIGYTCIALGEDGTVKKFLCSQNTKINDFIVGKFKNIIPNEDEFVKEELLKEITDIIENLKSSL